MKAGHRLEDPFDILIRHNQELLARAGSIHRQCSYQRARCHEALRHARAYYAIVQERQKRLDKAMSLRGT